MLKTRREERQHERGTDSGEAGRRDVFPNDKHPQKNKKTERNTAAIAQMRTNLQVCTLLALSSLQVFYAMTSACHSWS